jgi:hypothetical protein
MSLGAVAYLVLLLLAVVAGIFSATGWFRIPPDKSVRSTGLARETIRLIVRDEEATPLFYLVFVPIGLAGPFFCLCIAPWLIIRSAPTGEADFMPLLMELPFRERVSYILFGPEPLLWLLGGMGILIAGAWLGVGMFVAFQVLLLITGVDKYTQDSQS